MTKCKFIFIESFINTFGILLFGFISIPVVAYMNGVDVTFQQGATMSFMFFGVRLFWNLLLRLYFSKKY